MFCPNCGEKLPEGSKFCGACGAKLAELVDESFGNPVPDDVPAFSEETEDGQVQFVQPKKKKKITKLIGIVTVLAVVIIAAFVVKGLLSSNSGSSNAYVYLSDGKYELITNLSKDKTIEIASSKSDNTTSRMLSFSPDGKYIYYYTKYDFSAGTGSLCRAEYGKLKENSNKNDNYIEVIATNVSLGFCFFDDGTLTYLNGDDTLYYYDGSETTQIAKAVNYYFTDDSKRIVYEIGTYDDGYTLYGISLSNIDNKIKLAANYEVIDAADFDNIFYTKVDDDYNASLYVVGFNKDSEKLGNNVNILSAVDGTAYFTATNGTTLNLYDYVTDSYATADSGVVEPDIEDYSIPTYSYDMITGSKLSESSYGELYTSCTRDLYWYGESTWWCYSMEEAVNMDWGDNTENIRLATQSFIDKFADQADEDGYILVTDEVKAALKAINKFAEDAENEWEWLWLCFTKTQSGTTYDYDAYDADYNKYYEAKDRITMREALQDKEDAYAVRTLYCYEDGNLTAISENVLAARAFADAIMFNTTDLITDTVKLENVTSIYDVIDLFSLDYEAPNYLVSTSGTAIYQMSERAAETFADAYDDSYAWLYVVGSDVYMNEGNGGLFVADISNGTVESFSIITDDAYVCSVDGTTLYYVSGEYTNNDYSYGDLYSYTNGKSARLAQDIMLEDSSILYSDGAILAYTGYRKNYGYELTMFEDDGTKTIIADDVTQYIRVDKSTLLYISDDDLYLYTGKERSIVRRDVELLWSQNKMEIAYTFEQ